MTRTSSISSGSAARGAGRYRPRTFASKKPTAAAKITLVGTPTTGSQTASGGGTLTIAVPTGTRAGDVLFFSVEVNSAGTTPATPSGLTLDRASNPSLGPSGATYYRVCDGTEPGSYSFTVTDFAAGTCRTYRGVDNAHPINVSGAFNCTTAGTHPTATSVTTTKDGCMLVYSCANGAALTYTPPAGFGNPATVVTTTPCAFSWDELQAAAGATGSLVAGGATGGNKWANVTALQPA